MTILVELFSDIRFLGLGAGISAFLISTKFYLYPNIISISKTKGLMDAPDGRKVHTTQIPTLGGLGVFIAFSLSIIVFGLFADLSQPDLIKLLAIIGSSIILLFLGIKDDLVSMSPKKKFLGQLIAVMNVVILTDVRILSLEGLLGVGELPYVVSIIFSIFVFVLVINALNLIDGIDGLAGSIAIISSASFGLLFLVNGHYMMTLISLVLVGALIGFLRYNLSSKQKIFMGDCGSMLTGFLVAYQGIIFLALNASAEPSNVITNAPIVLLAVLSYPLFDLLRVFAVRIKAGKSPFDPDANHIHHRLLRLGLSHIQATLLLCICNAFVIGFTFLLTDLEIHVQLFATVLTGSILYLLPFLKVFEANVEMNLAKRGLEVEPVTIASQEFKNNDTFEFDFKPIKFFEEDPKNKKTKGITLPVDYIMNIEVETEAEFEESAVLVSQDDDEDLQKNETLRKKRIMTKRLSSLKTMVNKD